MPLQIYVYDAAAYDEPELVEELDDLEDAISRCHDLVENDGHTRAEAWDAEGDCRYGVVLRGGVVRTYGAPRFVEDDEPAPRAATDRVAERAPVARADLPPAAPPAVSSPKAPAAPSAAPSAEPPRRADGPTPPQIILGEKPVRPDLWFG